MLENELQTEVGDAGDQGGKVIDLHPDSQRRNDTAVLDDLRKAADRLTKIDEEITACHARRKQVRDEFIKKHDIKMGMWNVMYRLWKLEDEDGDVVRKSLQDLAMSAEALGLQLELFPQSPAGGGETGTEGAVATDAESEG